MKKLIAILVVMMVVAGAVFAANNDKLVLESKVGRVNPNFKIYSGATASTGATTVDTGKDISEEDIEWVFTIKQGGSLPVGKTAAADEKAYSKYRGTVSLGVEIKPFKATVNNQAVTNEQTYAIIAAADAEGPNAGTTTAKGAGYSVSGEARLSIANGDGSDSAPIINANDNHKASVTLTYSGKKVTDENAGVIATIVAKWTHDENLPMDGDEGTTYTADVVLTYTVNN